MENSFQINVIGVLFKPELKKIMVGKREGDEKYSFIEGLLPKNEEIDKFLKRMTKEKTGYVIHNLGTIFSENMTENKDKFNVYFLCEATEGEEIPEEGIIELKWINPCNAEEIMQTKFPTRLKEFISNIGDSCSID